MTHARRVHNQNYHIFYNIKLQFKCDPLENAIIQKLKMIEEKRTHLRANCKNATKYLIESHERLQEKAFNINLRFFNCYLSQRKNIRYYALI